jgi:hypothetical protein
MDSAQLLLSDTESPHEGRSDWVEEYPSAACCGVRERYLPQDTNDRACKAHRRCSIATRSSESATETRAANHVGLAAPLAEAEASDLSVAGPGDHRLGTGTTRGQAPFVAPDNPLWTVLVVAARFQVMSLVFSGSILCSSPLVPTSSRPVRQTGGA